MNHFPPIARNVIIIELMSVQTILLSIIRLPLSPRSREVTIFALSATSYAWRISRVIDAPQVAFHLPSSAWNASLVHTFVLRLSCGRRPRSILPLMSLIIAQRRDGERGLQVHGDERFPAVENRDIPPPPF